MRTGRRVLLFSLEEAWLYLNLRSLVGEIEGKEFILFLITTSCQQKSDRRGDGGALSLERLGQYLPGLGALSLPLLRGTSL